MENKWWSLFSGQNQTQVANFAAIRPYISGYEGYDLRVAVALRA